MHTNFSIAKNGKNLFYDKKGVNYLSNFGWKIIKKILSSANDICLILNSSVNAYRRLDPHFEAPNEIKVSPTDRGAMIRIPIFNEKSARIEIRSVGPDANPYLLFYTIIRTALEGKIIEQDKNKRFRTSFLPSTIYGAVNHFKSSDFISKILGEELKRKYLDLKQNVANRSPADLGIRVKNGEVWYHHEVYNQIIWNYF